MLERYGLIKENKCSSNAINRLIQIMKNDRCSGNITVKRSEYTVSCLGSNRAWGSCIHFTLLHLENEWFHLLPPPPPIMNHGKLVSLALRGIQFKKCTTLHSLPGTIMVMQSLRILKKNKLGISMHLNWKWSVSNFVQ